MTSIFNERIFRDFNLLLLRNNCVRPFENRLPFEARRFEFVSQMCFNGGINKGSFVRAEILFIFQKEKTNEIRCMRE